MNKNTFLKRAEDLKPHVNWNEVARRSNLSENTVNKYINGRGNVIDTMIKIIDSANSLFRAKKEIINAVPAA